MEAPPFGWFGAEKTSISDQVTVTRISIAGDTDTLWSSIIGFTPEASKLGEWSEYYSLRKERSALWKWWFATGLITEPRNVAGACICLSEFMLLHMASESYRCDSARNQIDFASLVRMPSPGSGGDPAGGSQIRTCIVGDSDSSAIFHRGHLIFHCNLPKWNIFMTLSAAAQPHKFWFALQMEGIAVSIGSYWC